MTIRLIATVLAGAALAAHQRRAWLRRRDREMLLRRATYESQKTGTPPPPARADAHQQQVPRVGPDMEVVESMLVLSTGLEARLMGGQEHRGQAIDTSLPPWYRESASAVRTVQPATV